MSVVTGDLQRGDICSQQEQKGERARWEGRFMDEMAENRN